MLPRRPASKHNNKQRAMKRAENHSDDERAVKRQSLETVAGTFKCSITAALIVDPVATADGQLYEKTAIERWLEENDTSPNTGAKLAHKSLTPLPALRTAIQHLVDAETVTKDERSDWLLRKGVACASAKDWAEAKSALLRAFELGQQSAGYHLGRVWMEEAAGAGVSEAVQDVARLKAPSTAVVAAPAAAAAVAGLDPIRDISEVAAGDVVQVLPLEPQLRAEYERSGFSVSALESLVGDIYTVRYVDPSDDNIELLETGYWFPMATCTRLRSANLHPFSSIEGVRADNICLCDEAACRAACEADGLDWTVELASLFNARSGAALDLWKAIRIDHQRQRVDLVTDGPNHSQRVTVPVRALAGVILPL